jgi:putative ABC transport system permease protein
VRIFVKPAPGENIDQLIPTLNQKLTDAHGGQQDITVLRQSENLTITDQVLQLLTKLIGGIAAISLVVGGIGIMNIMLVSVSERTYEIGIRKAVGATNRQIRNQFMAEAITLSLVGGTLGVIVSFIVNFVLKVATNFHPVITWPVVAIASGFCLAAGIIFGTIPAVKAARKDPIQALRGER